LVAAEYGKEEENSREKEEEGKRNEEDLKEKRMVKLLKKEYHTPTHIY